MRQLLDTIELDLEDLTVYIDVADNTLARKWLAALNGVIEQGLHLEKNYLFHYLLDYLMMLHYRHRQR